MYIYRAELSANSLRILVFIVFASFIIACDTNNNPNTLDLSDRISSENLAQIYQKNISIPSAKNTLIFGFDLRNSPTEDAKQYLPFISYLSQATGLQFELKFTPKSSDIATELGEGRIHLAAIGATSYIKSHESHGVTVLARGTNNKGKAEYRSVIVVRPFSKLRNLENLKGERFAFGNIDSTQGHLIPRIELANHNIFLQDFSSYQYTGSHVNCANAVISGQMDACGMQDTLADEFVAKGLLRKLYTSPSYPSSGIAANQHIAKDVIDNIIQALITFEPEGKHKNLLYHWDKTEMSKGFVRAKPKDYAELRKWMIEFKLLAEAEGVH